MSQDSILRERKIRRFGNKEMEVMSGFFFNNKAGFLLRSLLVLSFVVLFASMPAYAAGKTDFCHEEDLSKSMKAFFVPQRGFLKRTSQGVCVAGRYVIYTRYSSDDDTTSYVLLDKEKGTVASHYDFHTGHSNSLTYNTETGKVVTVSSGHAYVFSLEGSSLRLLADLRTPRNFCKIAYVAKKGGYYLGTGNAIYFSRDLKKYSKVFNVLQVAVNQGMACDGSYIYINWYRYRNNQIWKYTLNGQYVGKYTLVSSLYCEIEEVDFDRGRMYVNIVNSEANGIYVCDTEHAVQSWHTEKEANCGEEGLETSVCTRCSRRIKRKTPIVGNHEISGWTVLKAPNCEEEGIKARVCRKCRQVIEKQVVPCSGHSFGRWKVVKKASARSEGTMERICELCRKVETKKVSAGK